MLVPFGEVAEGLDDLVRWERHRIELMELFALRGHVAPPPHEAFAGWRERLVRCEAAHRLVAVLIPHEARVRLIDARLIGPPQVRGPLRAGWPA